MDSHESPASVGGVTGIVTSGPASVGGVTWIVTSPLQV